MAEHLTNKNGKPLAIRTIQYWEAGSYCPVDVDDLLEPLEDWLAEKIIDGEALLEQVSNTSTVTAMLESESRNEEIIERMSVVIAPRPTDDDAYRALGMPSWLPLGTYIAWLGRIMQSDLYRDVLLQPVWMDAAEVRDAALGRITPIEGDERPTAYLDPATPSLVLLI